MSGHDLTEFETLYSSGVESPEGALKSVEDPEEPVSTENYKFIIDPNDIGEFRSNDGYVTKIVVGVKKQIGETTIKSKCLEIPISSDISTNAERNSDEWISASKQWMRLFFQHPNFNSLIEELKEKELKL